MADGGGPEGVSAPSDALLGPRILAPTPPLPPVGGGVSGARVSELALVVVGPVRNGGLEVGGRGDPEDIVDDLPPGRGAPRSPKTPSAPEALMKAASAIRRSYLLTWRLRGAARPGNQSFLDS